MSANINIVDVSKIYDLKSMTYYTVKVLYK